MRVIAGAAKGRRLAVPDGRDVRPTADRVKEALFSSLQPLLGGAAVLDLYAGSGGLGLEARSRGAGDVVLVEADRRVLSVLADNVATVGLDHVEVLATRVPEGLARLDGRRFDLVLADPPYRLADDEVDSLLAEVTPLLADEAVVVVERGVRSRPPRWPDGFTDVTARRYGEVVLHRARWVGTPRATTVPADPSQEVT